MSIPIVIRRANANDAEAISRIFEGPKVVWGTGQLPFPSAEYWRKRLADLAEGSYFLVACAEGEVVGHLGLHTSPNAPRRRHAGQIGMAVRDDWQGKGVGTALLRAALEMADRWLNLARLELQVYTDNEAAVHLYQKHGFVIEGTMPRFVFRDGRYADAYAMGRLRPEG